MPRYLMKLTDQKDNREYYLEWSTVVDAPVSYGADINSFKEYYERQYGKPSMQELQERLKRVEKQGTSCAFGTNVDEMISCNRAGTNESTLSKEEILDEYCRKSKYYCA